MREGLDPAEAHVVGSTSTLNLGTSTDYVVTPRDAARRKPLRDSNASPCFSVVLSCHPVERYSASRCADHRTVGGEGDDRPAMQQPDQPGDVIAAQAAVVRPTLLRRVMKAKQVLRCPAQRLRSLSPLDNNSANLQR
jgi:hypothetical protein